MMQDTNDNQESWDTKYFNDFKNAKIDDPKILEKLEIIPERTKIQRSERKDKE
jgi:hypothetical protein